MEHQNLFLYENNAAMNVDYPDKKVDNPIPGVAYARADANSASTVIYNKKKVTYTVTVSHQDRSGNTVTANTSVETPLALEGRPVKVNIVAEDVADYKPILPVEKIEVTQDTAHTCLYLTAVTYVVTVHHMYSGSVITADTTVTVPAFEEETVGVELVPGDVVGYVTPDPVRITVSSDTEYTFEYDRGCPIQFIDLGLPSGTLWATTNLGAATEDDLGDLYAWGEIETKAEFTAENYRFFNGYEGPTGETTLREFTKYNSTDNKKLLDDEDDVARLCGCSGAHIPTVEQCYELLINTYEAYELSAGTNVITAYTYTSKINSNVLKIRLPQGYLTNNGPDCLIMWTNSELTPGAPSQYENEPDESSDAHDQDRDYGTLKAASMSVPCEGSTCVMDVDRWTGLVIRPVMGVGPSMEDLDDDSRASSSK